MSTRHDMPLHQAPSARRSRLPWRVGLSATVVLALIGLLVVTLYLPTQPGRRLTPPVSPGRASAPAPRAGGPLTVTASVGSSQALHTAPNGPVVARLSAHTSFGSPRVVPVVRSVPGWLGVIAPQLHNGRIGWIRSRGAQLDQTHYSIRIETRRHQLTVFRDGRIVRRMTAGVGQPAAATPSGRFAVTDRLHFSPSSPAYGCCALALSAHEYHLLPGWTGGDLVAIHSTPDTSSLGKSISHGCVRVSLSQGRWLVDTIPLGTLVTVRNR